VLYHKFHEAEFARPDLDVYIQDLYHDEVTLNVVFLCEVYNHRQWCGLEWRAIRDLIKRRRSEIMFLRIDEGDVAGVYSIDGYVDIRDRSDEQAAALIAERLQLLQPSASPAAGELLLTDGGKLRPCRTNLPFGRTEIQNDYSATRAALGSFTPACWATVNIRATFCYATETDPQDPLNYTRAGLEVGWWSRSIETTTRSCVPAEQE
jgi:hypothetical protein